MPGEEPLKLALRKSDGGPRDSWGGVSKALQGAAGQDVYFGDYVRTAGLINRTFERAGSDPCSCLARLNRRL